MNCVGLDLSILASGVAFGADGGIAKAPRIVELLPQITHDIDKLMFIRDTIMDDMDAFKAQLVVIEDAATESRQGKALERFALSAMIRAELRYQNKPYLMVRPNSLKKFVSGNGQAKKDQMMAAMALPEHKGGWDLHYQDDNLCDATGLLYIGMAICGDWTPRTDAQIEVLKQIRGVNFWLSKMFPQAPAEKHLPLLRNQ
jgi:Holliday junction resolvasome RuvABC endonuclease subunit